MMKFSNTPLQTIFPQDVCFILYTELSALTSEQLFSTFFSLFVLHMTSCLFTNSNPCSQTFISSEWPPLLLHHHYCSWVLHISINWFSRFSASERTVLLLIFDTGNWNKEIKLKSFAKMPNLSWFFKRLKQLKVLWILRAAHISFS